MTGQLRRGRGWDVGPGALGVPSVFGGGHGLDLGGVGACLGTPPWGWVGACFWCPVGALGTMGLTYQDRPGGGVAWREWGWGRMGQGKVEWGRVG